MNSDINDKSTLQLAIDILTEMECPSAEQVVEGYHKLYDCSCTMLGFAEVGAWAALVEEELRYIGQLEDLIHQEHDVELSGVQQEQKSFCLERIMGQSLEIKRLLAEGQQFLVDEAEKVLFKSAPAELPSHWNDEDLQSVCIIHELQ